MTAEKAFLPSAVNSVTKINLGKTIYLELLLLGSNMLYKYNI